MDDMGVDMSPSQEAQPQPEPWHLIPLHKFRSPSAPASEAVRTGVRALWEELRQRFFPRPAAEPDLELPELRSAPAAFLERVVPTPDWSCLGMAGLVEALEGWQAAPAEAGPVVLVAPPHSHLADRVCCWAREQGYPILEPPNRGAILAGDDGWLSSWSAPEPLPLVLPHLERCFLRHHRGLALVRRLLEQSWSSTGGRLLVCDSWAWNYLVQACQVQGVFPRVLTPAPLGAEELAGWFWDLAATGGPHPSFRQADDGNLVIHPPAAAAADQATGGEEADPTPPRPGTDFLNHVAARSRVNPGVAWAIWRHSLYVAVDEDVAEKAQAEAAADRGPTIWVRPWERLELPSMPAQAGKEHAFVAQSLLIHGGLPKDLLAPLLPLPAGAAERALEELRLAGLVQNVAGEWTVTALGYPAVRSYLRQEGYGVDDL